MANGFMIGVWTQGAGVCFGGNGGGGGRKFGRGRVPPRVGEEWMGVRHDPLAVGDGRLAGLLDRMEKRSWRLTSGDERLASGDERLASGDGRLAGGDERLASGDERMWKMSWRMTKRSWRMTKRSWRMTKRSRRMTKRLRRMTKRSRRMGVWTCPTAVLPEGGADALGLESRL